MKKILFLALLIPHFVVAQIGISRIEVKAKQQFYKTGDWSSWLRYKNASYRYHWGLNPLEDTYNGMMDVTFEIRNEDHVRGWWQIEILVCNSTEVISKYTRLIALEVSELKNLSFLVPNCGTAEAPRLHYQIRRMIKID